MENTILLIEDEAITGKRLQQALETSGIHVVLAKDRNDALAHMEKGKFDLIILDLKFPGGPGDVVLEEIRKIDAYVEVIVRTAYSTKDMDPDIIKRLFKFGVTEYIEKEEGLGQVVKAVQEKLRPFSEEERTEILGYIPEGHVREHA